MYKITDAWTWFSKTAGQSITGTKIRTLELAPGAFLTKDELGHPLVLFKETGVGTLPPEFEILPHPKYQIVCFKELDAKKLELFICVLAGLALAGRLFEISSLLVWFHGAKQSNNEIGYWGELYYMLHIATELPKWQVGDRTIDFKYGEEWIEIKTTTRINHEHHISKKQIEKLTSLTSLRIEESATGLTLPDLVGAIEKKWGEEFAHNVKLYLLQTIGLIWVNCTNRYTLGGVLNVSQEDLKKFAPSHPNIIDYTLYLCLP